MDDEEVAAVELEQQVLAAPLDARDLRALELGDELLLARVAPDAARAGGLDGLDPLADDLPLQLPTDGFDFRQFGHQISSPGGWSRPSSDRRSHASRAAAVSACFFERPS